jgi:hypothetical protein
MLSQRTKPRGKAETERAAPVLSTTALGWRSRFPLFRTERGKWGARCSWSIMKSQIRRAGVSGLRWQSSFARLDSRARLSPRDSVRCH